MALPEEVRKLINLTGASIGSLTVAGVTYVKDGEEWREATPEERAAVAEQQARRAAEKAARKAARTGNQSGGVSYNFGDIAGGNIYRINIGNRREEDDE